MVPFRLVCLALALYSRGDAFSQNQNLMATMPKIALAASVTKTTSETKAKTSYGHLFRHFEDISVDCWLRCSTPEEFLLATGFSETEIGDINEQYPQLMKLNVHDQLAPKIRFVIDILGGGHGKLEWANDHEDTNIDEAAEPAKTMPTTFDDEECEIHDDNSMELKLQVSDLAKEAVPYDLLLKCLLDRTVGPWHAYLKHTGLPHGKDLLLNKGERLREFLNVCSGKASKSDFLNLCVRWGARNVPPMGGSVTLIENFHTLKRLECFEDSFRAGLIAAAQSLQTPSLEAVQSSPGHFVELLLSHGANYRDTDDDHNFALHWASGSGNLQATKALLDAHVGNSDQTAEEVIMYTQAGRDGATPIHWVCCGIRSLREGHEDICRLFLTSSANDQCSDLANVRTWTGNTPLMFAAWSGSLEMVKMLLDHGADPHLCNDMGCNAAHFAATGGHLDICQYLCDKFSVDIFRQNENGDSALDQAIAFDRRLVVDWMADILNYKSSPGSLDISQKDALEQYYSGMADTSDISRRGTMLESLDIPSFNVPAP